MDNGQILIGIIAKKNSWPKLFFFLLKSVQP